MLGDWKGSDSPLRESIVKAAAVDSYLNRVYTNASGGQIEVYVGYYANQQTDKWIHSPKNCLPGGGWEPVRAGRTSIDVGAPSPVVVNEYLIQKGLSRFLVLYWYQERGRVIASEYMAKFWLVADAMTRNRTDGALVRVLSSPDGGEDRARARMVSFLHTLYPELTKAVPD